VHIVFCDALVYHHHRSGPNSLSFESFRSLGHGQHGCYVQILVRGRAWNGPECHSGSSNASVSSSRFVEI